MNYGAGDSKTGREPHVDLRDLKLDPLRTPPHGQMPGERGASVTYGSTNATSPAEPT